MLRHVCFHCNLPNPSLVRAFSPSRWRLQQTAVACTVDLSTSSLPHRIGNMTCGLAFVLLSLNGVLSAWQVIPGDGNYVPCGCAVCTCSPIFCTSLGYGQCRTCEEPNRGSYPWCDAMPTFSRLYTGTGAASGADADRAQCESDPDCNAFCHADHESKQNTCFLYNQDTMPSRDWHYCHQRGESN